MEGDGLEPRNRTPLFEPDEDGPPPRKKLSRFFPGGKSVVGNLPSTNRKASDSEENTKPLIEDQAYIARPQASTSRGGGPDLVQSTGLNSGNGIECQEQPSTEQSTARPYRNRFSQAKTALKGLTGRDRRRDGIIGYSSLLRPGSNTPPATYAPTQGSSEFAVNQSTDPSHSTPTQSEPTSSEDAIRQKGSDFRTATRLPLRSSAAFAPQYQGISQAYRSSQQPPLNASQSLQSGSSTRKHGRGDHVPAQEARGPVSALLPQVRTGKVPLDHPSIAPPFLPPASVPAIGVDLDRDVSGKKLPAQALRPIHNLPNKGITNLPLHATINPNLRAIVIPKTYYTSPGRIQRAMQYSRKRKRTSSVPPPAAFTYQRTNDPNFNVFNGILLYPELVFHLAGILPLRDLISLYSISRDFHTIIDTRFTTTVLRQSTSKAPECSRAFPFRCYAHLCRKDPAARIPHPNPIAAAAGRTRLIPSFRWLAMILHREKVVHEIMAFFAEDGVPLPMRCSLAIKRLWFILDIPDNARRIGFVHNTNLFTDLDLYFAMCFFIKLDMRLNDPCGRQVRHGMRKLLLSQESFTTILKVLKRDMWPKQLDVLRAWTRWKYDPREDEQGMSIFGVPFEEIGKMKFEYWGRAKGLKREAKFLLRPDQLVMREAVKRGLRFHKHFLRSMMYGYVRMDTIDNYAPRKMNRRLETIKDEYAADDDIGGLTWRMEKAGLEDGKGGDMLDLGERKTVSLLCIDGGSQSLISPEDRLKMEEQEQFLEACMRWSEEELEEGDVDARMLLD